MRWMPEPVIKVLKLKGTVRVVVFSLAEGDGDGTVVLIMTGKVVRAVKVAVTVVMLLVVVLTTVVVVSDGLLVQEEVVDDTTAGVAEAWRGGASSARARKARSRVSR